MKLSQYTFIRVVLGILIGFALGLVLQQSMLRNQLTGQVAEGGGETEYYDDCNDRCTREMGVCTGMVNVCVQGDPGYQDCEDERLVQMNHCTNSVMMPCTMGCARNALIDCCGGMESLENGVSCKQVTFQNASLVNDPLRNPCNSPWEATHTTWRRSSTHASCVTTCEERNVWCCQSEDNGKCSYNRPMGERPTCEAGEVLKGGTTACSNCNKCCDAATQTCRYQ